MSRFKLGRKLSAILISIFLVASNATYAKAAYPDAPADLEALKLTISKSLVKINWSINQTSVGFAGTYNISQDQKDSGINSIVVTTFSAVSRGFSVFESCFAQNKGRDVTLEYNMKKYPGKCSGYNAGGIDLATVNTSLNLPMLSLYDSYIPSIGQWVLVVHYVDGFGIVYTPSRVRLVNSAQLILAIDKVDPSPSNGALVFNSLGNFLGVVTSNGVGSVPSDYLKVQGAPFQCQPVGQRGGTITICPDTRDKIWTKVNPGSSPQSPALDASQEGVDAAKAVEDAYNAFQEAVGDCVNSYNSVTSTVSKYLKILKFNSICNLDTTEARNILTRSKAISSKQNFTSEEIGQLNSFTDSMNSLVEEADSAYAQIQDAISYLEYAIQAQIGAKDIANIQTKTWDPTIKKIAKLPNAVKLKITSSAEYSELVTETANWKAFLGQVTTFLGTLNPNTDLDSIESRISDLKYTEPNVSQNTLEYDFTVISKQIPKYLCVKGKEATLLSGNTCKAGYKKTLI